MRSRSSASAASTSDISSAAKEAKLAVSADQPANAASGSSAWEPGVLGICFVFLGYVVGLGLVFRVYRV